jgi:uncharacterized Tic20 family protein
MADAAPPSPPPPAVPPPPTPPPAPPPPPAPGAAPVGGPTPAAPSGALSADEKTWGMLAHLLVLIGLVVPFIGNLIGPAIAYFVRGKDQSKFVRFHAIQAFVFNLLLNVVACVLAVPFFILFFVTGGLLACIVYPLGLLLWLVLICYSVYMGIQANKGEYPRYILVGEWSYRKVFEEDWKPV